MWTAHPKYDSKVDVFSCAMVFWEMLQWHKAEKKYPWEVSRLTPRFSSFDAELTLSLLVRFQGMNEHAIYDTVGTKKLRYVLFDALELENPRSPLSRLRPSTHKLRSQWGTHVVDLMESMWAQEPKERPTMTDVVDRLVELMKAL